MRAYRRLAALILALCLLALTGCDSEASPTSLTVCVGGGMETLDPIYAVSETDCTILNHLYENLMRISVDVEGNTTVDYGLAKSVSQEENHDGTVTWTFKLRSAKWSDSRAVKADDFVYAWQRLADPLCKSPNAALLSMVAGYDEARESGDMSLLQVTAKNDTTLEVVLSGTCEWFLPEVCTAVATVPLRQDVLKALKEDELSAVGEGETARPWWSSVKRLVTSGPYVVSGRTEDSMELSRSARYTGTGAGMDVLTFRYTDSAEEGWALYETGEVDFVWPVPEEQLAELPEQYQARNLSTCAVLYNGAAEVFLDPQIRQAMALAVDRSAVAELAGVTARTAAGLVPDSVPQSGGETFREAGGELLNNDPETVTERQARAAELLREAGYDSGEDLGPLQLFYADEGCNGAVAKALAAQWYDVLRVRAEPTAVTVEELRAALSSGEYTMAITEVGSLCNDAEGFLMQWTTDSGSNVISYSNSAYDTLLAIVATASDSSARMGCLHDAEALLLEDGALSPLYTTGTGWRLRETLQSVGRDARGWFTFSFVSERSK